MLKPGKFHANNHQELKTTPHMKHFRPICLRFI